MDGEDVGDSGGGLKTGWWSPQDLEAALRTSGSLGSLSIFDFAAGWTSLFFALSPLWWPDTSTGRPPWKPAGGSCPQSTPPAPPAPPTKPAHSQHKKRGCDCLLACYALFKVWLQVWPLMQFLFSPPFNNCVWVGLFCTLFQVLSLTHTRSRWLMTTSSSFFFPAQNFSKIILLFW